MLRTLINGQRVKTVAEILKLSTDYLQGQGLESPRKEAEYLLSEFLNMNRLDLYLNFERPLEDDELDRIRARLKRRGKGEPGQYIHGSVHFYELDLMVDSSVLIPRPETEILVDHIVKALKMENLEGKKCLDLCSGSGCIGLSLKNKFSGLSVYLSDLSESALAVAKKNAETNHLVVSFSQGDLFEPLLDQKFDYIICNPPYISLKEYDELSAEVREFEPKLALVGGVSGFEFYERLSEELPGYLNSKGRVWLEIGTGQGQKVLDLFSGPSWAIRKLEKDWAGHDRFILLERE